MRDEEAAALGGIRAVFAEPIIYTGAGLMDATIMAVFTDAAALRFQGPGDTLRQSTFEVAQADLPARPMKTDIILQGAKRWKVNNVTQRDDIAAWELVVEEAQP